jgi:hypothetical protein
MTDGDYTGFFAYLSGGKRPNRDRNNLRSQIKTLLKSNTPKCFCARGERFSLKFLFDAGYYSSATGGGVLSRCHSFTPFTSLSPPNSI